jgi:hypothetical protein
VLLWDGDQPLPMGRAELYGGVRQATGACELGPRAIGTVAGILIPDGVATLADRHRRRLRAAAGPLSRHRVARLRARGVGGRGDARRCVAARLDIALERVWRVDGALVADLHVHAARSNDSGVPDTLRAMSQACAGIQVTALSDHASNGDLTAAIAEAGLGACWRRCRPTSWATSRPPRRVPGARSPRGAPRGGSPDPKTMAAWTAADLMAWATGATRATDLQINHPRFRMYALFDNTGWNGVSWPPPFPPRLRRGRGAGRPHRVQRAGDRRIDEGVRDFYTL